MGAKKKSKANKLARMSEEERIRYLQHRAAIEEEARRRKEQLISTFLKNKLQREQIFSRLNVAKINQQWRQILRQIKCQELKQDLEDLNAWFDYTLRKKNELIEMVLSDLDEAENQYSKMHWAQMETIDRLIRLHEQRVDHYFGQYECQRNEIHAKAIGDINDIKTGFKEDEEQLQAAIYRTEETFKQKTSFLTSQHFYKVDELRNNMLTDLENLKNARESQIEKIWLNFEATLNEYWEQTEDRRRQYMIMRNTDHDNCRQIFENNQQINGVIDLIESLKNQLSKAKTDGNHQISNQKKEKDKNQQLVHRLKQRVVQEMDVDRRNLNHMNSMAGKVTEELKAILEKGEQVLKLYGLCSNLEAENEQVRLEDGEELGLPEREEKQAEEEVKKLEELYAKGASNEVVKLEKFWKRYNGVLLEKEALVLYCRSLSNEQKYLKSILRGYFSELVVKQPESKVSYANGVRFIHRRPSTTISLTQKHHNRASTAALTEATQSPSIRKSLSAKFSRMTVGGK